MAIKRTYHELIQLKTFEERFEYLRIGGKVGSETFGFERYLNQTFYRTKEWRRARRDVIVRDLGCDLGLEGYDIIGTIVVHHMNPVRKEDVAESYSADLINPEFLICTSEDTHKAIHYGNLFSVPNLIVERKPGDTCLWK